MTALPDYAEALRRGLEALEATVAAEEVALAEADGRVLRAPIVADRDLPPFDRAQMDGYALRAADLGAIEAWPVARRIAAGQPAGGAVPAGHCVAIATGAPVPAGLDTVIQHELSDLGDPVRFDRAAAASIACGHAVHPRGADARRGQELVAAGTILRAHHVGLAAAVGATVLRVARRPRATVISSGDEVRPPEARDLADHQIRNSNAPQACALLRRIGADPIAARHVADEAAPTIALLREAVETSDLVLTIGGVSAGERDHVPAALAAAGVALFVEGAAIQPGKPIAIGRARTGAIVVALPGNPVSSLACTCLFAWPIVRALLGADPALPWREAVLAAPAKPNARRRAFRPAVEDARGRVTVPAWAGSGDLAHTAPTSGLAELPVQAESLEAGTAVRFLRWP
jgi:molybdopterin molybdotransferase